MYNYLPGTTIELDQGRDVTEFFKSLFSAGGLVLSQVLSLTGLSVHTVQNWVKRQYLRPPVGKKYDCSQFCTIALINILSGTFCLDSIKRLISYAELLDKDAAVHIYTLFIESLAYAPETALETDAAINRAIDAAELSADIKERLRLILEIMFMAHFSSVYKLSAQSLLNSLDV